MPEQIIGAIGSVMADVRFIDGSNALYVYDAAAGAGTTNVAGSVQVSSIVGALPAGTNILGSVKAEITNAAVNVDVTISDYVSIVGSPNYNLPVSASISFDSVGGSSLANLPVSGLAMGGRMDNTGSYAMANIRNAAGSYAFYVYDIAGTAGTTNVNVTQVSGQNIGPNVPTVGSVQVSSIVGALPAGTALLGSVVADIVGLSTSDYVSIVGSPSYSLPVIGSVEVSNIAKVVGSVQVSSIVGALPAGTALLGSVVADAVGYQSILGSPNYSLPAIGSVQVSSIVGALPAGTANIGDVDVLSIAAGTNLIGSVVADVVQVRNALGSVQVSSIVGALPAGTNNIGDVDVLSIAAGTNTIGSVLARISDSPPAWTGMGSVVDFQSVRDGSAMTFDWVGPVTGSVVGNPPTTGSRWNITDIICAASGQGIVTLFFDTDNTSLRIAKANLANQGGFVMNYSKPLRGPASGSIRVTTAATGFTPVGFLTVNAFQSA